MKNPLNFRMRFLPFVTSAALAVILGGASANASLIAGFESSEGYTLGALAGQQGWTGANSPVGSTVSSAFVLSGSRSLAVAPGSVGDERVVSPNLQADNYSSLSFGLKSSTTPGGASGNVNYARFRLVLGSDVPSSSIVSLEFYFRWGGTEREYQISHTSWNSENTSTTVRSSLGAGFTPTAWNSVAVVLAPDTKSYSLYVNDSKIAGGILLPNNIDVEAFQSFSIWSIASATYNGTVYYDDFTGNAIPEPGTTAFLLIAGVGLGGRLLMRRKGKE